MRLSNDIHAPWPSDRTCWREHNIEEKDNREGTQPRGDLVKGNKLCMALRHHERECKERIFVQAILSLLLLDNHDEEAVQGGMELGRSWSVLNAPCGLSRVHENSRACWDISLVLATRASANLRGSTCE